MIVLEPQDELNDAVVGYGVNKEGVHLIYDYDLLVKFFEVDMGYYDAVEWVDFNVVGAYFGKQNPVIVSVL